MLGCKDIFLPKVMAFAISPSTNDQLKLSGLGSISFQLKRTTTPLIFGFEYIDAFNGTLAVPKN